MTCVCVCVPPDCSLKVKDVLREFDADGRLAQHRHGEVRGRFVSERRRLVSNELLIYV